MNEKINVAFFVQSNMFRNEKKQEMGRWVFMLMLQKRKQNATQQWNAIKLKNKYTYKFNKNGLLLVAHQYGLSLSRWFHDANSEYDVIFDCVSSVYLSRGMLTDCEFGIEPALLCLLIPDAWLEILDLFL